jgi:hypothetical protein
MTGTAFLIFTQISCSLEFMFFSDREVMLGFNLYGKGHHGP